jgi:hypothetical protein
MIQEHYSLPKINKAEISNVFRVRLNFHFMEVISLNLTCTNLRILLKTYFMV